MEKCLIYVLTCKKCRKQYLGQTVDTFPCRWNNYKIGPEISPHTHTHTHTHTQLGMEEGPKLGPKLGFSPFSQV